MKPLLDLGWGDPVIVRQALIETLGHKFGMAPKLLESMGYTPHLGYPHLIEQCKDLAKRQSGHRPKHLFISHGATGAIHAALYALKAPWTDWVVTNRRYFPIYPQIISLSDMIHIDWQKMRDLSNLQNGCTERNFIRLVDSPSNPEGLIAPFGDVDIWDAAYATGSYSSGGHVPSSYKIMCGSLSKTLGLSGLRIGWVSTDDDELAKSLGIWVTANYIGLSSVSQNIAEEVLQSLDMDRFETRSSGYLDDNRQQMQKLLSRFGQSEVPLRGMFCVLQLGKPEKKALDKANIKWTPGSAWGEDDNWARLSLGQTREITKAAVKAALK
jgi:aspartate/methionine/tyrosine aminotransferase